MKKVAIGITLVLVIILITFLYSTRPVSAPTQSVESVAEKLPVATPDTQSVSASTGETFYRISPLQSQVEFSIGEILNGSPFTAVGKTSEVAGDVSVSKKAITVGKVAVNAKTFKTDSSNRDGAIARFILKSDQPANEFITFTPAQPIALASPLVEGKEISATVSGTLTISGITKPATFTVRIKMQNKGLVVTGDTTVKRSDFGLQIPDLSFIASVDDLVKVSISATADLVK